MKNCDVLRNKTNQKVIIWTTLVGGFMSSLVKWGSEVNMPPRMPGEISPPGAHLDAWFSWMGFNSHSLDYVYQGVQVPGAVTLYHWLFSFAFAFLYVLMSAYWPRVRMWYGAMYGLVITIVMHGFFIPLLGFRNPAYAEGQVGWLWNLNGYELWSEILGHVYWSVSIEICLIAVLAILARPIKGVWIDQRA
ncbi:YagU family protein [Wohlfahrtiimonas chitiniclastica]|uniref:YagU family protein n=1 Tax=Wohlfahrtiimonas chitiniclastica TaxID=400946 RepID=UPI000B9962F6|nr:DUF1440 domain-containing protein [Wohlfahrtiimonas chitiniclastica]OYQ82532.1 hypothetical protein B9T14_09765 [Wohlfahrtiimonas chitiniclastica]OYQ83566.1 hypothetical protein B9T15_09795 [Wohlfahrtiimonas chitiniclastica]